MGYAQSNQMKDNFLVFVTAYIVYTTKLIVKCPILEKKMYKSIMLSAAMALILSSCSFFQIHQQVIEQGNIIDPSIAQQLHPGMTEAQVTALMGNPLLVNIFTPGRTDYVYTYSK